MHIYRFQPLAFLSSANLTVLFSLNPRYILYKIQIDTMFKEEKVGILTKQFLKSLPDIWKHKEREVSFEIRILGEMLIISVPNLDLNVIKDFYKPTTAAKKIHPFASVSDMK